ncbi:hypothetical protein OG921_20650 [Aldersonia sp. NBC_00410]|uniref:hypothetical protein n=1 Tax=Aldersonia sp. NBC_00410 TaxID=2975954 RepID=UPI00225A8200|nr:hypothetical protein [Aldersonia sp. NBC_00410]MCX5045579.1 hypothetical protein [Aldersonia sp. NBC_00410]
MTTTDEAGTAPGSERDDATRRPGVKRWAPLLVAGLLVAATSGAAAYYYREAAQRQDLLDAEAAARDAACAYAPTLANYDFDHLDAYFAAVLDGATGAWKTEFDKTSKDLRDVLSQGQVVSKAATTQCALRTGDTDRAEAIVVIGQSITSAGTEGKEEPGQLSMVLSLENHDSRWLVSKVDSPLLSAKQ